MKTNLLTAILLLLIVGCEKDVIVPKPEIIGFDFSFSTERSPISVLFKEINQTLYVANYWPSIYDYSSKILVYSNDGTLIKTVADFESFNQGHFDRYELVDFTFDNKQSLYVLVRPLIKQPDQSEAAPTGFTILQFDTNDNFKRELDFSTSVGVRNPSSISYFGNCLYIAFGEGKILKKISIDNQQVVDISIPKKENDTGTWPYLHNTDMEFNTKGRLYFTGQASFNLDTVGCHISIFNPKTNELNIKYAKGWTWLCCAGFNNPGIYISNSGYIYLANFYNMSIEIYNEDIGFITDFDTRKAGFEETRPIDIVCNDKRIYVADELNDRIHVFKQN